MGVLDERSRTSKKFENMERGFCTTTRIWCDVPAGHYEGLTPQVAFKFSTTPSVGQIALAFLQASFAFSGWNFLNYVTEEVVDPRR